MLLLPLLAIAAILVYFFVPEKIGRYSLNLYCLIFLAILTGILLLFVLVRLASYLIEMRRIKKQEKLLVKAEVWRIQESLTVRWEKVKTVLRSAGVGLYDMPWYLIVGRADSGAQSLLESSKLTFHDLEEAHALISDRNVIDRWVFANEAIFIDTTGRSKRDFNRDSEKAEWEAFLSLLARQRHRCPINGVLLPISAFELANDSEESRKEKARQILSRFRQIQNLLGVRIPLYLVVTQMEKILGFSEFFSGLKREEKEQMLGWSNPNPPDTEFSLYMFLQAFDDLSNNLKEQRLIRMGKNISQDVAHRAVLFPEEFASLARPLSDYVELIFKENRFAEPPLFRGFYFTGSNEPGSLATLYCKKYIPANVLESIALSAETRTSTDSLFINDLFTKKVFLEPGLVTRTKSVFRKNLLIKVVRALIVSVLILLGTFYLFNFVKKSARELQMLEADVHEAYTALQMKGEGINMLPLCIRLTSDRKRFEQKGILSRILGLGKFDVLIKDLNVIHRSLFQETTLQNIVDNVENGLNKWVGDRFKGDPDFPLFSAALIEYIKWSNPTFRLDYPIDVLPFLDFLQLPQNTKYQYVEQFQIYLKEGGRGRRIVSSSSEEIIRHALGEARVYLRPAISDPYNTGTQLSDAQWWLSLATQLQQIQQNYNALIYVEVPYVGTPVREMYDQYAEFRSFLYQLLLESQDMLEHIKVGRDNAVFWIDVDDFYQKLLKSSHGVAELETAIEKDRMDVASDYKERVVVPITRLSPVINILSKHQSQSWLVDVLVRAFGHDFIDVGPDFGVGNMIFDLLNEVESYNQLIEYLYASFDPWMEKLPNQITNKSHYENPLRNIELNRQKDAIHQSSRSLTELATKPFQPEPTKSIKPSGIAKEKPAQENQKEEKRKAVAAFWQVLTLCSRINQWLDVQDRMRMYTESLFFQELFNRANFQQGILNAKSWYEIKNMEIFRNGDGIAMVTPINDFLVKWIQDIPQSIRALAKGGTEVKHYPELNSFENLLKEVMMLQETYMQKLRISASNFARCIQAMDMDVGITWQTLRDSPWPTEKTNQLVCWENLRNLSIFKEYLEMEKGPTCKAITSQLEQIESHIFNIYSTELLKTYQSHIKQIFDRYSKVGIADKFPFRLDGMQIDDSLLLKFLDELKSLERHFELEEGLYSVGPDGKKTPLYPVARSIVNELTDDRSRRFYKDCSSLELYLFKKRTPRSHKFKASIIPGPVGSRFHWVRIVFGNGTIKDINVYGEPIVEMTMVPGDGSVTLHGLDAARIPQASAVVAKGDHAFLQMIYLFGKPVDEARTTWLIDIELPMSVNPLFTVKCTFKYVFSEGLPILPNWEDIKQ